MSLNYRCFDVTDGFKHSGLSHAFCLVNFNATQEIKKKITDAFISKLNLRKEVIQAATWYAFFLSPEDESASGHCKSTALKSHTHTKKHPALPIEALEYF